MTGVTPDQVAEAVAACWNGGFTGAVVAVFVGGLFRDASFHFLFLFLRRLPAWRRFDRAMSRYFRGLAS